MWLLIAAWLLFGASWLLVHTWIVPRIEELRPRLEVVASRAIGVPVRIGEISADSVGLIPSFELRDVTLLDAEARVAVRLSRVVGVLSPASLWGLGFDKLFIERPELDMRRTSDGKIFIGGLDVSNGLNASASHSPAADWLFSQPELTLRGGRVRWTDELQAAPTVALHDVDLTLRNSQRRHLVRVDATPPEGWGDRFTLQGSLRHALLGGSAGDLSTWTGQLFFDFGRVDMSGLRQYVGLKALVASGVDLQTGQGALRAWGDVRKGRVVGGTADIALQDVDVRLGAKLGPLALTSVAGRVAGVQRSDGFEVSTERLAFRTRDGLQWPGGNLTLAHTDGTGPNPAGSTLKADQLDLAALAQIASRLPLDSRVHQRIAALAPQGVVEKLDARWDGPLEAPDRYSAKGRVVGLSLAAQPASVGPSSAPPIRSTAAAAAAAGADAAVAAMGVPGIAGASTDFELTQAGGKASVTVEKGVLDAPGVFDNPRIPVDKLSLEAQWSVQGSQVQVQLRNLQFANADIQGQGLLNWRSADAKGAVPESSTIEVQGSLSRADGARIHRYLPLVVSEQARHYVRDAVVQGQLTDVKFKVAGPVQKIPFSDPRLGEFKISARLQGGQLAYVPAKLQPTGAAPWPALTQLSGELLFNRASIDFKGVTGRVLGLPALQLVKGEARIPDMTRNTTVEVSAALQGPLADGLQFVNLSPLSRMTNQFLASATGTGNADYRVKLQLPVFSIDDSKVEGVVTLPGNDVQFLPAVPVLGQLKGAVAFSERGFSVADARARWLGGTIRIDGGMRPGPRPADGGAEAEANVLLKVQGTVTAEGLRQSDPGGWLARVAGSAAGSTTYAATVGVRRGVLEVTVNTNLQGLALSLPAPLNKSADSSLPLLFEKLIVPASLSAGQRLQDRLLLSLNGMSLPAVSAAGQAAALAGTPPVAISYVRDISGAEAKVLRGSVAIGTGTGVGEIDARSDDSGRVTANVNLPQVNLDAWERIFDAPVTTAAGGQPTGSPRGTGLANQAYLPTTLAIRAKELVVQGRKLNEVVVGATRDGTVWRANVNATELNGYLEFRQPGAPTSDAPGGSGRLYARLSRLSLAPSAARDVETLLSEQPVSIPALDIVVDDVELRGRKLGRVEIEAVNRSARTSGSGVREWRLNKFNVILPEARLTATGQWAAVTAPSDKALPSPTPAGPADRRRTVMNFRLDIDDSGELLRRFGMPDVIRRGRGKMEGEVAWTGSPLGLDYPTLGGQFNINLESGQFVKAEPGIAKLLGVLSLQSLPRRLTLDFRDVFSEGFSFDFVRGDVTIQQGLARTNNLQMSGVNAAVLMDGSADIARETQDLRVVVVPEINAGTASLIATAINPLVGLGTFLAQAFLRRPLMQAATQELHIDGTWADPRVTKVDRSAPSSAKPATVE